MKRGNWIRRYTPLKRHAGNKYGARPVHNLDTGQSFDSTGESTRYRMLELLARSGAIADLALHPVVTLIDASGKAPAIKFRPDYSYKQDGRTVFEDYKPRPTTDREALLFKLWQHFGPGPLHITGRNGTVIRIILPSRNVTAELLESIELQKQLQKVRRAARAIRRTGSRVPGLTIPNQGGRAVQSQALS